MSAGTRNHTGERYGALQVGERTGTHWEGPAIEYRVTWLCCGAESVLGQRQLNSYRSTANRPKTCYRCRNRRDIPDLLRESAQAPNEGLWCAGWGWVPYLRGPMGPRHGWHTAFMTERVRSDV